MEILGAPSESVPRSVKSQLSVDSLGGNEYRATNLWMTERMRAVYGGQVMGQALVAASMCVHDLHPSFLIHSYHCYFVGPMQASPDWEVRYMVTRVKDGTNFCSVSVGAVQRAKVCFHCLVSFQKPEAVKADLKHTGRPMPIVPHPRDHVNMESLSDADLFIVDTKRLLITEKHHWKNSFPCDMYLCMDVATAKKQLAKEPTKPKMSMWIRGQKSYEKEEHQNLHYAAIAYASDMMLARLVLNMYPWFNPGLLTSLDHSMWFHMPVDSNKWHFFDAECENAAGGRSLTSARVYSEDGTVVATCIQESLIRPKL